jgi:hypothetical protein
MNKTLKFQPQHIQTILSQEKITTPRMFDDKNLVAGDIVDFVNTETGEKFASGKIIGVREMTFQEMVYDAVEVDEVYNQYKQYYRRDIKPKDIVKWIDFDIIKP